MWIDHWGASGVKMDQKANYIILENSILLSKKDYANWREIQDDFDTYKASLGPYTKEELIAYLRDDIKYESEFPISIQRIESYFNSDEYLIYENGKLRKEDFQPKEPWFIENNEEIINSLRKELEIEIHEKHYLYKKDFRIIGSREDKDEIVLYLNNDGAIVFVHLTWKQKKEDGCWPICKVFLNKIELDKQIDIDNSEYEI